MVAQYGPGVLMGKSDITVTYCNITIHPDDHLILGMKWLYSFSFYFSGRHGWMDFNQFLLCVWFIALPGWFHHRFPPPPLSLRTCTPQCAQSLSSAIAVCKNLGLPLHPNKCMPATPQQDLEAISNVAGSLGYGIYFWDLWFYAPHTPT